MHRRLETRLVVGLLIWVAGLVTFLVLATRSPEGARATASELWSYIVHRPVVVEVEFDLAQVIRVGDPVFGVVDGQPLVIGRICQVENSESTEKGYVYTDRAFLSMNNHAPKIGASDYFTFHETPDNIGWVIETMLPKSTRDEVADLITQAYRNNYQEIAEALRPIIGDTLRGAADIIEEDLREAMQKREAEFARLGERFKTELIDEDIVPLIQHEIWPIVRQETEPLVALIMQELWEEVSIWRFTWRALYDATPMTNQNLTGKEFQRFFDREITPILEAHVPEFIELQKVLLTKITRNKEVEAVVSTSFTRVVNDPEVQQLMLDILRDVFVGNDRLRETIEQQWKSPRAVAALETVNQRLDPTIVEIGALLFGSIDEEIADDFATVLRNRIMRKDNRWLTLVSADRSQGSDPVSKKPLSEPLPVKTGSVQEVFPGHRYSFGPMNGEGGGRD